MGELEKEIILMTKNINNEVQLKNFRKASQIQDIVYKMERIRKFLPNLHDMKISLKEMKEKINTAILSKKYMEANYLNNDINQLEQEIKDEMNVEEEINKHKEHNELVDNAIISTPTIIRSREYQKTKTTFEKMTRTKDPTTEIPINQKSVTPSKIKNKTIMDQSIKKNYMEKYETNNGKRHSIRKLRPKKPILSVCQILSIKRSDAALIVDSRGSLVGILTDIDITLRVVAKNLNPSLTLVSKVMTINPKMVSMDDFAMDALAIMMDNHFRHLPVVNKKCEVVGLLDIAKCLNDAIEKLELIEEKKEKKK